MDRVLRYAIDEDDFEAVKAICDALVTYDNADQIMFDALNQYCHKEKINMKIIRELIENAVIDDFTYPLCSAIQNKNIELIQYFVEECYADVDEVWLSSTPLHYAIHNDSFEICSYLIDQGCDVNKIGFKISPLYNAISKQNISIVKLLIDNGADVNQPTLWPSGKTPLIHACEINDCYCVQLLLESGASTKIVDKNGMTVFDYVNNIKDESRKYIRKCLKKYMKQKELKITITLEGPKDQIEAIRKKIYDISK
jgi:ankyrin repeat protein